MRSLKSNLLAVHGFRPAPIFVRRRCKYTHLFSNNKQNMKIKHPETEYFLYYSIEIEGKKNKKKAKRHKHYKGEMQNTIETMPSYD